MHLNTGSDMQERVDPLLVNIPNVTATASFVIILILRQLRLSLRQVLYSVAKNWSKAYESSTIKIKVHVKRKVFFDLQENRTCISKE